MAYDTGVPVPFPKTPIPLMFFEVPIWTQTFQEDADVTTIQQANLRNDRAQTFRFVPNRERMSQSIHHLIWQAYRENLTDVIA